jgi:hypothetical protein
MRLRSSAFPDGTTIPRRFTCDGTDLLPSIGATHLKRPAALCSFVTILTLRPALGVTGRPTTFPPIGRPWWRVPHSRVRASSRRSMISNSRATAALAHRAETEFTDTVFVCLHSRSIVCQPAESPPAKLLSARRTNISWRKRPLLELTRGDRSTCHSSRQPC